MPPAAMEATDESADFARNDALPAAAAVPQPTVDRTPSRPETAPPAATAGTTPAGTGSAAAARAATDSLVAAERRDTRVTESPPSPAASPAAASPPPSQSARLTSLPSTAQTPQPSPPVVSGAGSLPGVPSPISPVQPYVPPPAPPPAVAATARNADAPPPRDDAALVRAAIEGYRRAYNSLDADAAARVWPTVDAAALGRAFKQLRSQSLTFDRCAVNIGGELARVECDGRSEWVPGVGDRSPRTASRTWHFDLSRADRAWTIVRVNVSQ
jgi:hypothetical protein